MLKDIRKSLTKAMQLPWLPPASKDAGAQQAAQAKPDMSTGKPPFPEIQFIRLSEWTQSRSDAGIFGGLAFDQRIFAQYQMVQDPGITLDFWYRGNQVSEYSGQVFMAILAQPHVLTKEELLQVAEILGPISDAFRAYDGYHTHYRIDSAEIGPLKSRPILSVRWEQQKQGRRFLTLFLDAVGDGRTVHEIHFSTPKDQFEENLSIAIDTFKSIQWASFTPPPMSAPPP